MASWLGRFASGADSITLSRSGDTLFADRSGSSQPLTLVGLATFADAAGTTYLVAGNRLVTVAANGARREWTR